MNTKLIDKIVDHLFLKEYNKASEESLVQDLGIDRMLVHKIVRTLSMHNGYIHIVPYKSIKLTDSGVERGIYLNAPMYKKVLMQLNNYKKIIGFFISLNSLFLVILKIYFLN